MFDSFGERERETWQNANWVRMTESFIGSDLALLAFATNSVQIFSVQMEKFHRIQIEFFFFWLLTLLGTDDDQRQKLKLNRVRIYLNLKIEFRHERENCYRWAWEDVWGTTKVISSEEYSLEIVFSLVESMLDSSTRVQITVHRNLFINFSFSRSLCSLSTILFHFSFLLRSCWNCSDRLSIELNFNNRRLTCFCSSISSESSPVANSFFCLYRV